MLRACGCGLSEARRILVLCTGNSARSILGEVLFNQLGKGRVRAFSAGSRPAGAIHPGAMRILRRKGIVTSGLRSKNWSEFAEVGAQPIDIVITVCGSAAGESCPAFPGRAVRAHWGLADPAAVSGDKAAIDGAFELTWDLLRQRIEAALALQFESMTDGALQEALGQIGKMDGAA